MLNIAKKKLCQKYREINYPGPDQNFEISPAGSMVPYSKNMVSLKETIVPLGSPKGKHGFPSENQCFA